jgi:heptose-I-phosphate ethanolaminephosphotransferase
LHIMIKNKLLLMKNIFTKQFRHFFLILFAVLLILQLLGSGTFIITKTKQLLFTVFITSCLTSIFSYSRIYFYNYLLALLPLLSLLFCKTAADEVITSVNMAYYSIFSLSFTNIIFFLYYYSTAYKTLRLLSPVVLLLQICTFLLSTAVWGYYTSSQSFPTATTILALLQTNVSESSEYLQTNFTGQTLLLFLFLVLVYLVFSLLLHLRLKSCRINNMPPVAIAVFVLLNLLTVYKSSMTPDNFFTNTLRETRNALAQYDNFSAQKNARQKILGSLKSLPKNAAGVYVLVIGESQNKGHMSAYGYHRPTTPWLQSIKNQHGFLLFDNAYSCHSHTVPVLTYALTAKNQYNTLPLEQAASIIEIAQAADFHTVWISNQVKYGAWDTPVSVIADQSQTQYWLNGHLGETTQTTHFDLSLVDVLKKLPVFDKALIVVHLMGNHGSYEERYPHAFNRWTGKSHIDNAYSCHSHTVPVLTYALTAKNQYNTLPLEQAASIIEIAQAADFHTVWISNQVKYGAWDTPVSVIADQSQTQYWLNGHLGETTQTTHFDLSLVDVLKKLPVFDKALIVVHLMGNHGSYEERYPHAFNRWTGKSHIDKYDNSILYNDFVMKQLFSAVKDLPNFQGMIYFSDHADDVDAGLGHDASRFTFDMARIPLYMYFSDNYIQKYPHTMAILKKHTSAYFTNDLIFDTLINIMQIPFPVLEETNSLADKNYKNTSTNLKTLYGKKSLSEDPFAD